jgi:hypothetical protein
MDGLDVTWLRVGGCGRHQRQQGQEEECLHGRHLVGM